MERSSTQAVTFGVISGVKLKKLDGVVRKTVHIDPVLQHNDDPRGNKDNNYHSDSSMTLYRVSVR